ncbi:hypothetical protein A3860_16420 [Niastella vici]|uniref:SH3b domain-containing protein n=1 Tax=Niastella vici TaxID=1703345 RepID=A0A1V9G3Y4_9BACT|nr:hypothetical protein [Niastella vici]OQP65254.1 hypothetical protein A3860_16420 [Niastella vici]
MKIFCTFLFLILVKLVNAQFAIIDDKDGYCNVRVNPEKGNNIIDKLENGCIVLCGEINGNWVDVFYLKNNEEPDGYVYNNRLKMISAYGELPILSKSDGTYMFGKDSIRVKVAKQKFDKGKNQLINGKTYWGNDGGVPRFAYQSITITRGNKIIELPKTAFDDLFEPGLHNTKVNYDGANDILYIQAMNGDGAGGYGVMWRIVKGKYKDRLVLHGF